MSDDSSLSDAVALDDGELSTNTVEMPIQFNDSKVSCLTLSIVSPLSIHRLSLFLIICRPTHTVLCGLPSSSSQGSLHHISAQSLSSSCSVEQTQTSSMGSSCSVEFPERSPIQNSPWRESNLDQPYLKPNTVCSSRPRSPVGTPVGTPVFPADSRVLPSHFPSIKNLALRHGQINSSSAPSTPELHVRRQYSLSFR
ncbi:unnamed protein product [Oncorhynchus mykiss]|uniref:Uncharacterized protein n=1 Tax=Oncorhynchus mykiss TaxID=8022 RepID=A0A060XZ36_ONCMY|nr:unnamed protein product [Oncorhynchus mykiss]